MPSTDTRIVQMQFDNRDFEKNIAVSQESLEKFKDELDFDEQEDNLRQFGEATKRINFDSMADNLQRLADKFTGLGTISELVLSQIRRGIENAAAKVSSFIDSMTTQQISAGMDKYEMLNKSVQTIKAATGRTEEDVYSVMKRLNDYTDQTSYNFADMAQNIGKFTSVGIPLEQAERQMEGIANWAARSGAGINEASRAMYNLSQAMGVGQLKLMDWKSIENAGMATKEFKEQLIEAGIAAGTLVRDSKTGLVKTAKSLGKEMDVSYTNLSETLARGWANKDVLGATLERYYYENLRPDEQTEQVVNALNDQQKKIFDSVFAESTAMSADAWKKIAASEKSAMDETSASAKALTKELTAVNEQNERFGRGTIDLNKRKTVVNEDGTISTELSFSTNIDGKEVLLPTVIDGKIVNEDEAIEHFMKTGEHLGMFDSVKEAEEYAERLHEVQDYYYNNNKTFEGFTETLNNQASSMVELKKKAIDTAIAQGLLVEAGEKGGEKLYKTTEKTGKAVEFTLSTFEKGLEGNWLTKGVAEAAWSMDDLAKASYEAAQKCLTFTDVLGAWKDQISTGWMQSMQHIFGNLSESMELFSAICNKVGDAIGELVDTRNGILEMWGEKGGRDSLWALVIGEYDGMYEGAVGILDVFNKVGEMIRSAFWKMIRLTHPASLLDEAFNEDWDNNDEYRQQYVAEQLLSITEGFQSFAQSIRDFLNEVPVGSTKSRLEMIYDVVHGISAAILLVYTVVKKTLGFFGKVGKKLEPSGLAILKLLSKLGLGIEDTAHKAANGKGLDTFFDNLLDKLTPLTDAINRFIELVTELIGKVVERANKNGTFGKIINFLGKLLSLFVDIVSRVAGPVIDFIGDIIDAFAKLFEEGISEKTMTEFGQNISNAIEKLINGILEGIFGSDAGKKINEFFGYIFGFDEKDADEEATTAFGAIKKWFKKIFGLIGGLFDGLKNEDGELTLFGLLKANLFSGGAGKFLSDLTQIFSGSNIYKITRAFGGLLTILKLIQTLSKAKNTFNVIGEFFQGLKGSTEQGLQLDVADKTESAGERFLKIAEGIALIAAAVAVLGSMKLESLAKGAGALLVIAGIMVLFVFAMKKIINGMGLAEIIGMTASIGLMGISLSLIAIAMSVLILALKPLAKLDITQIANMLTGFAGIILIFGLFVKYIAGNKTEKLKASKILGLAIFAIAMGVLIKKLIPLSKLSFDQIVNMLIAFGGILAELILFVKFMNGESFSDKGMWSLVGLAVSMVFLILSLKSFSQMPIDNIWNMLIAFGGILAELVLFAKFMDGATFGKKGMLSLIVLAIGISTLVRAIMPLANVEWGNLAKMGVGLAAILIMLKMFNSGLGSYRFTEMAGLIAVALSIRMLIAALLPLAKVEWKNLGKMAAGLAGVLIMLYVFMENCEGMKIGDGFAALLGMIGFAAVLLAFGVAMSALKDVPIATIVTAVLSISVLMVVYFAMIEMINNNTNTLMKGTHALIAMAGLAALIFVFALMLNEIKNVKTEKIMVFSLGVAALILAIGPALQIVSKMSIGGAIKGILILGVAIAALMAVLALVLPLVIGSVGSSLEQLSAKLTIISNLFTQFISNMGRFSVSEIDEAKAKFDALYNLVSGLQGVSQYLPAIDSFITIIQRLGSAMELYTTLTRNVTDPEGSNAFKLIDKIVALKDKVNGFELGNFAQNVQDLGSGIAGFVSPAGGGSVTEDNPKALTLLQNVLGCKDQIEAFAKLNLDGFTQALQGLGGALSLYAIGAKEVSGLTEEELSVDGVQGAVTLMQSISQTLNDNGGFTIPDIPSEDEIGLFPSNLAALANAMVTYANACENFEDGKADNGIRALEFLGELNSKLTTDNLKVIDRTKSINYSTLSRFGLDIRSLGGALYDFYDKTKDFGDITNATNALTFFKQLGTDLTEDAINATLLFDQQNVHEDSLGRFSNDITALGGALQSFANNTKFDAGTTTTFDNALVALQRLVEMRNAMPNVGGIVSWFTGHKMSFNELADDVTIMGSGLAELSNALTGVGSGGEQLKYDADLVNSALGGLLSLTQIISTLSEVPEERLQNGFSYASILGNLMDWLNSEMEIEDIDTNAPVKVSKFSEAMAYAMASISESIAQWNKAGGDTKINREAIDMFARMAEGLSALVKAGQELQFEDVGLNIALGVAKGIESKDANEAVETAAKNMIVRIHNAAVKEADEHSPSVLFRETVGRFLALGVAEGIDKYADSPEDSAKSMIDNIAKGSESAMAILSKLLSEDLDTNPTITPILDLTNVDSGIGRINGLFGSAYGLSMNGGSITIDPSNATMYANATMPSDYSNAINDVSTELSNLREDVQTLANAMKNIKLVMNTGAVVGAIGPDMDAYLGQRGFYATRTEM